MPRGRPRLNLTPTEMVERHTQRLETMRIQNKDAYHRKAPLRQQVREQKLANIAEMNQIIEQFKTFMKNNIDSLDTMKTNNIFTVNLPIMI